MLGLCLASMGAANAVTLSIGLAQELTPPGLRARVVSVFMMIIYGLQPVAAYLVGLGADRIGLQRMVLVNGVIMVVIPGILLSMPKLRHLKRGEEIVARKSRCVGY
jgi:MFS family permease